MSMFCGLPVKVATEPLLEPMHTASRYGTGGRRASSTTASTSGVSIRHTVSLTRKADSSALMPVTATRSSRGVCASRTVCAPAARKNAACAMDAASIIIPSSRTRVSMSTACRERSAL
jgi:hypothetical protein